MWKSKRFIAFSVAVVLFVAMVFLTKYPPLELGTAITMIVGVYLGAQTLRGSDKSV